MHNIQRLALKIEYDGSSFNGWQKQNNKSITSVQATLEAALSKIANQSIEICCAGRTDKGVHARGQVIHFDSINSRNLDAWVRGTNSYLPASIRVVAAQYVPATFNARRSAIQRHYQYIINNAKVAPAIMHHGVTWCRYPLEENIMQTAAKALIGEHDFSSFRGADCQSSSPIRKISSINIYRENQLIFVDISGNAFLHHMVRNIAGVLMDIGSKKLPVSSMAKILQAKDRTKASITAPANGLYLVRVDYMENLFHV